MMLKHIGDIRIINVYLVHYQFSRREMSCVEKLKSTICAISM